MKVLRRFCELFLPYVFCVFFPLLLSIMFGTALGDNYREKVIVNKSTLIEDAFRDYQLKIEEIERIIGCINDSDTIEKYVYSVLRNEEISIEYIQELMEQLEILCTSEEILDIYLYDSKSNRIISSVSTLSDSVHFFRFTYQIDGYTPEECAERLTERSKMQEYSPILTGKIHGADVRFLEIGMHVPMKLLKYHTLQLVVAVDADAFFKELYRICGEGGEFYVYDEEDQLLFSNGSCYKSLVDIAEPMGLTSLESSHEQLYAAVLHSADDSWKLKIYLPQLLEMEDAGKESSNIVLLLIACSALSIVFCFGFTMANYKEIKSILMLFTSGSENTIEIYDYRTVKSKVEKLIDKNYSYQKELKELNKEWLINQLLHSENKWFDHDAIDREIKNGRNVVLCIRYEVSNHKKNGTIDATLKDFVKSRVKFFLDAEIEVIDTYDKETVFVIYYSNLKDTEETIREIVNCLNKENFLANGDKVLLGVGGSVENVYEIGKSYCEAKEVIKYNIATRGDVLFYSEMKHFTDQVYFPEGLDTALYNSLIAGKEEEAKKVVQTIYEENLKQQNRMLTLKALDEIKKHLMATLVFVANKRNIALQLDMEVSMDSFFEQICDAICLICRGDENMRQESDERISDVMMEYINKNYANKSLSMDMIAAELGFHKDYLTRKFKADYGRPTSEFIERLRIEKACELLKEPEMTVSDIVEAVGYASDVSFRRSFKKLVGLTPIEYKKIYAKDDNN